MASYKLRNHRGLLLATAALAALPIFAGAAYAQDAPNPAEDSGEIVVTAQKRAESVRDVPQSLAVAKGEDLTSQGIQNVEDLASQFPGVSAYSFGGAGQNQINIRGVTVGFDTAPTVATYIDDIPFGSGSAYSGLAQVGLELGTFDVQRVELLRGPQGTLYGASALGGLLKYVLNEPDLNDISATLQTEGSANAQSAAYAVRGALNLPIVSDRVAVRVSGLHAYDGGLVNNVARGETDIDSYDKQVGRITLAFAPTDRLKLRATALAQQLHRDGSSEVYYNRATGKPVYGDFRNSQPNASRFTQEAQLYSFGGDYDLDFATLQATVSRQRMINTYVQDASEAYPAILSAFFPIDAASVRSRLTMRKTTAEVRLASSGKQPLEWIVGLFYTDEDLSKYQKLGGYLNGAELPINIGTFDIPATYREKAAYGNVTYHFTDRLDATLGVRVSRNDQNFEQIGTGLIAASNQGSSDSDNVVTYLGTVRYHLSGDNMIYARAASGYRPGGPNLVISDPITGVSLGATSFKPDTLWNYEIGVKLRPISWLTADISAFHIDWSDIQLPAIVNGIGVFANGGTAKSQGVEFALNARPTSAWTASLSGAWTNSRLTQAAPDVSGRDGERLPNTPRWSLTAATDYRVFDGDHLSGSVGASWKYLGKRTASFDASASIPQYVLPSFHTVDLRASLEAARWTLDLYVRNLFDTRGQLSATTAFAFAGGPARVTVNRPRTFGAILTTRF
jgi:outer membrane receptor protein involved in Fe transport